MTNGLIFNRSWKVLAELCKCKRWKVGVGVISRLINQVGRGICGHAYWQRKLKATEGGSPEYLEDPKGLKYEMDDGVSRDRGKCWSVVSGCEWRPLASGAGEGSGLMSGLGCARACVFARAGHVGLMIHWAASCHLSRACLRDHCGLTFVIFGVYLWTMV